MATSYSQCALCKWSLVGVHRSPNLTTYQNMLPLDCMCVYAKCAMRIIVHDMCGYVAFYLWWRLSVLLALLLLCRWFVVMLFLLLVADGTAHRCACS